MFHKGKIAALHQDLMIWLKMFLIFLKKTFTRKTELRTIDNNIITDGWSNNMANEAKDNGPRSVHVCEKVKNKWESVVNDSQISLIDAMITKATILKNDWWNPKPFEPFSLF